MNNKEIYKPSKEEVDYVVKEILKKNQDGKYFMTANSEMATVLYPELLQRLPELKMVEYDIFQFFSISKDASIAILIDFMTFHEMNDRNHKNLCAAMSIVKDWIKQY